AAEARAKVLDERLSACTRDDDRDQVRQLYLQREAEVRSAAEERARRAREQEAFRCLHDFEPDSLLGLGKLLVEDRWDQRLENLQPDVLEQKDAVSLLVLACRQDRQGITRKSEEIQSMPAGFRAAVQRELRGLIDAILGSPAKTSEQVCPVQPD